MRGVAVCFVLAGCSTAAEPGGGGGANSIPWLPPPMKLEPQGCGEIDPLRIQHVEGTAYLLSFFAIGGDTEDSPTRSTVTLYEDGKPLGPAHASDADVAMLGGGHYRHADHMLRFSTSDGTDPRTNGRTYSYSVTEGSCPAAICGRIDATSAAHDSGHNFILVRSFGFRGDTNELPSASSLTLFENEQELGPPHSLHDDIRASGGGRFSHWGNSIYFSSSDGSDPRNNARDYLFGGPCRRLVPVEVVKVADHTPAYSTFQSHNQKLAENEHGIFMTYLHEAYANGLDPAYGDTFLWKLVRSTDMGESFTTVFEDMRVTKAPAVETDEEGNVYVMATDLSPAGYTPTSGAALFYRFSPASGFADPATAVIPGGAAGKFALEYDAVRQSLYYFTYAGTGINFYVLDKAGNVLSQRQLVQNGPVGQLQYPHLTMDGARLFAAWTTVKEGVYLYWDIHFAISDDGGASWHKADGTPVATPILADDSGPADAFVLPDELGVHNWLSNMSAEGGFLHFMYESQLASTRQHYLRYDLGRGTLDINVYPDWRGELLSIKNLDGFFAAPRDSQGGLLYAVSSDQGVGGRSIVVLASDDHGATWFDYGKSPSFASLYAIGGAPAVTSSGLVIGSFTNVVDPNAPMNGSETWFLRVPAQ